MKSIRKVSFLLFIFGLAMGIKIPLDRPEHKIILERFDRDDAIVAEAVHHVRTTEMTSSQNVMSVRLSYPSFEESRLGRRWAHSTNLQGLRIASAKYYYEMNRSLARTFKIHHDGIFISQYSPYVFYSYQDHPMSDVFDLARKVQPQRSIGQIHLFPRELYNTSVIDLDPNVNPPTVVQEITRTVDIGATTDLRDFSWDHFPENTQYTGKGVKIGLLDSGFLDVTSKALAGVKISTLYDTYTANDDISHPTTLAAIIGGFFGLAPAAEMFYVDVNSEFNFVGIERLINAGVDVINMSVALESNFVNGEYPTNLEGYIDYLYSSTRIPMIAASGNTLGIEGSGGYVTFPGLCANVITVGSIYWGGQPSDFSSFRIKNDVYSKPNIVAFGESRPVEGIGYVSGTSYSTAATTGAAALLLEKYGSMDMPELASVLMASANYDKIYKNADMIISVQTRDNDDIDDDGNTAELFSTGKTELIDTKEIPGSGMINRFGAGALDITRALELDLSSQFKTKLSLSSANPTYLTRFPLEKGQKLDVAGVWERPSQLIDKNSVFRFNWKYQTGVLANYDLELYDSNGKLVASTSFAQGNCEVLRFTATATDDFTLKLKPQTNCRLSDANQFDYSYSIH